MSVLWKVVLSVGIVVAAIVLRWVLFKLEMLVRDRASGMRGERTAIWGRKFAGLLIGAGTIVGVISVWVQSSRELGTVGGLIGAGIAVASQQAILSIAGFFFIFFGRVFNLGERIEMDAVRGDVVDVGLLKTTIMEMGVTEREQPDPQKHWVSSRQYSGRLVTISNSKVFDSPVYNFSRTFDFLWDEIHFPIKYGAPLRDVERFIGDIAREETEEIATRARPHLEQLHRMYLLGGRTVLEPETFVKLTDNWIDVTVRFLVGSRGSRYVKSRIAHRVLAEMQRRGLEIASSTSEITIVRAPPLEVESPGDDAHPTVQ